MSETHLCYVYKFLGITFSLIAMDDVVTILQSRPANRKFQYIIPSNVYHVVKINEENYRLNEYLEHAEFVLNDSRILQFLSFDLHKVILPLVRGSDLIIEILNRCVNALDEITVIGGDQETISRLKERFRLQTVHHMNPSMGFDSKPAEIEEIVDFVVSKRSKFVIFSVGVPRQEMLCAQIFHNPEAVGTGICVGAGIEFAAGTKVRAPRWMQIAGLEWLFRLLKEPRRLGRRYLVEDMAIFPIFFRELRTKIAHRISNRAE